MPIGKFVTTMLRVLRVPPNLEKSSTTPFEVRNLEAQRPFLTVRTNLTYPRNFCSIMTACDYARPLCGRLPSTASWPQFGRFWR
jgi:hypothetical protein